MYQKYIKGMIDAPLALLVLVTTLPIAFILIAIIKLDDKGPVIFKQKRFGQSKKIFTIYKFRTMSVDAPSEAPTNSLRNAASHITRVGKVMRKLSLDELPQLVNVLKGEMSIVGPRPVILKEIGLIAEREKYGANACKPGITGWAQVNGRDELRMKKKAKMDGEYASNLSPIMDIKCVLMTIHAVVSVKGHKEGGDDNIDDVIWEDELKPSYGTRRESENS